MPKHRLNRRDEDAGLVRRKEGTVCESTLQNLWAAIFLLPCMETWAILVGGHSPQLVLCCPSVITDPMSLVQFLELSHL